MKLSKILLASFITLGLVSTANANNGTIHFEGQVIDTPCSINPGDDDQAVDFGTIALASLTPGATTAGKPFDIKLQGCDTATVKTAEVTFTGATGHGDTFGVTGSATNIGILITGNQGVIAPGSTDTSTLTPGNNILTYQAAVAANSSTDPKDAVTAGNFAGVANYTIAYQ